MPRIRCIANAQVSRSAGCRKSPFGDQHVVEPRIDLHRHALEVGQRAAGVGAQAQAHDACEKAQRRQAQAALEHVTPRRVDQLLKGRVGAGVDRLVVVGLKAGAELAVVMAHQWLISGSRCLSVGWRRGLFDAIGKGVLHIGHGDGAAVDFPQLVAEIFTGDQ